MNLLLVEDDDMLAQAVMAGLQRDADCRVERVADAQSARLALVDHGYTAVLLDLGLPKGSGLGVLQAMRAR